MMDEARIGSSLEDFLKEEGIYEEVTATAIKRVLAWQMQQSLLEQGITKSALARQMHTSRTQIDRLLDPTNNQVQLDTLQRAAKALGRKLVVELV